MIFKKAVINLDSGENITMTGKPLKEFYEIVENHGGDIRNYKPIFFSDDDGNTTDIVYPNHISSIHFM